MKKLNEILTPPKIQKNQSTEFQIYGSFLAEQLGDLKHCALYIKLAKQMDRQVLETALNFVKGAGNVQSKPKLFMWKLKQLKGAKIFY